MSERISSHCEVKSWHEAYHYWTVARAWTCLSEAPLPGEYCQGTVHVIWTIGSKRITALECFDKTSQNFTSCRRIGCSPRTLFVLDAASVGFHSCVAFHYGSVHNFKLLDRLCTWSKSYFYPQLSVMI